MGSERHALRIGAGDRDGRPELPAGFDSAETVAGGKAEIEQRLERMLTGRGPEDLVLLDFHLPAFTDAHDRVFFRAEGTDPALPYSTAVPADLVRTLLLNCRAGLKLVLLDGQDARPFHAPGIRILTGIGELRTALTAHSGQTNAAPGKLVAVGTGEQGPVYLDFTTEPHFLAFGESESGKSALLRHIARGIMARYSPAEALFLVVDYRHSLLGVVEDQYRLGYAMARGQLDGLVRDVAAALRQRLPGPWRGPDLFVLVDDYDLVATQAGNPLQPLAEFLPHAREIGLHLVVARSSTRAARASEEPVLRALKDVASPGIVLSAHPDEGVLLGDITAGPLPPGRGTLLSRTAGRQLIQVSWSPPA